MSYRDELSAAFARIADLERKLAEVTRERDRLAAAAAQAERTERVTTRRRGRSRSSSSLAGGSSSTASSEMLICCKACGGANEVGAVRCALCGDSLEVSVGATKAVGASRCPVCRGDPLEAVSLGALSELRSCRQCGGLWVSSASLEKLLVAARRRILGFEPRELDLFWEGGGRRQQRHGYLFCPDCGRTMLRRAHGGSRVVLDVCVEHGIWCDHGELPKLLEAAAQGDVENPLERAKAEKLEGAGLLGGVDHEPVLDWLASLMTATKTGGGPEW